MFSLHNPGVSNRTFISLFSGAGGLDLGLERAGWSCRYASDIDPVAVDVLRANQGRPIAEGARFLEHAVIEQADLRSLDAAQVLHKSNLVGVAPDLLAGGPPCQAWSSGGSQRGFDDPRGALATDFVRLASILRPQWLLMENVRGLLTARGPDGVPGSALDFLRTSLLNAGYRTWVQLLNAADYGIPQRRVRLFIIGSRLPQSILWPSPTHAKTTQEAFPLLEAWIPLGETLVRCKPLLPSEVVVPSEALGAQLNRLSPGTGLKSAGKAEATRPGGHWGYTQGGFLADAEQPARTITASAQQDWVRDPEWGIRRLCPRECAAVQTFPSDWEFPARPSHAYRMIGNAVPPALAEILGRSLLAPNSLDSLDIPPPRRLEALPRRLQSAIEYTAREEARNGPSRRATGLRTQAPGPQNGVLW